jgi:hypothetical protein
MQILPFDLFAGFCLAFCLQPRVQLGWELGAGFLAPSWIMGSGMWKRIGFSVFALSSSIT